MTIEIEMKRQGGEVQTEELRHEVLGGGLKLRAERE